LSAVTTEGADAGVAIRAGEQLSGLFGAAFRRNGRLGYGAGLEGRVSYLVTELDGEAARRKVVASPWVRVFADVWADDAGRYVRVEAALNLVSRKFESRDYSNPRWVPWSDPSLSPSTITASAFWEPRWSIGLAVGFHPPRRVKAVAQAPAPEPAPEVASGHPAASLAPVPVAAVPAEGPGAVIRPVTSGGEAIQPFAVYFQAGRHALTNEAVVVMNHWLAKIGKDRLDSITIEVGGHSDPHGSRRGNLKLSRKRAEAVASFLARHGVNRSRISVKWFGSRLLAHQGEGRAGWAAERRVDGRAKTAE
jgi:outer membrane protein OmpA-like peptidoglycan-associated protein